MANLLTILRLLRPFLARVLLSLLLGVLTIGSGIALMMTAAWLISTAALQLGITSLGLAPVAVRLFGLARAVFRYLERLVSHDVTFRLLAQLRVWFYERLEPLSLVQLQTFRSGDLMGRVVADIDELQNFYLRLVSPALVAVVVTIGVGLGIAFFDGRTALVLAGFMLAGGTLLPLFTWWVGLRAGRQVGHGRNQINAQLVDVVQGLADSLAFGYGRQQARDLHNLSSSLAAAERRLGRLDGLQGGLSLLLVNLAAISVLWVAIGRVDGVLLAAVTLGAIAAFEAITPLALAGQNLGRETAAADHVLEIIENVSTVPQPAQPTQPPIENFDLVLEGITFRYLPEEPPVLSDFSLAVPQGGRVLITGESGAGKSSLINALLRLAPIEAGCITVGGVDLSTLAHEEVVALFGTMTQRTHLFNTTIRENIRIGRKSASDAEIDTAARAAHIHDFIQALPQGYDTYVGEEGVLLSGGERQRLALARLLLKDAPIWLLDEVTANLDPVTAVAVMDSILAVGHNRTLLVITHRPELVDSHRFGKLVQLTPPHQLPTVAHIEGSGC
jgi:ATP-binding cassette, subfamily C, bacterial CydC